MVDPTATPSHRPGRDAAALLAHHLWPEGDPRGLYMVVDAARDPGLYPGLVAHQEGAEMRALYQGDSASELAEVAPYLVRLERGSAATRWLLGDGWGRGWGILALAGDGIDAVRRHFRKLTIVNGEKGETYLFRFYDPVVLNAFLPTCDAAQRAALFGRDIRFMMEDAGGDALAMYETLGGDLRRAVIPLAGAAAPRA